MCVCTYYIEINLTKHVADLSMYLENYKTLKKETEEDTSKWKHILCLWTGKINIIKLSIPPKAMYRFSAIPIKIPMMVFYRTRTNISEN